jgi:hypothetical protein
MKNINIQNIKIVTLALILALGISYASAAWTPAPSSPPNSNTDAPINVGVSRQAKVGGMAVGTSSLQNLIDGYSFAVPSGISLFKTIVGSADLVMYGKIGAGVPNYATGQWPSVTLDVNGDSWIRGNIKVSGTRTLNNVVYAPGPGKVLTSADSLGTVYWATPSSVPGSGGSSKWATSTNGTDIYNGNLSGNVGIGTQTPTTKLAVSGNGVANNVGATVGGRIQSGDSANTGGLWTNTANTQFIGDAHDGTGGAANSMMMWVNGQARLVVNPSGNVGIGTMNPTAKLDVVGNMKIGNYYFDGNGYSGTDDGWLRLLATDNGAYKGLAVGSQYVSGNLTTIGSASITGDVGIGTANPSTKLEVVGTVKATGLQATSLQITGGTGPLTGKVLTSDASGNASWSIQTVQTIRWDKWVKYSVRNVAAGGSESNTFALIRHQNGCNNGWIQKETNNYIETVTIMNQPPIYTAISETTCVRVDPTYSGNAIPGGLTGTVLSQSADPYGP